MVSFCESFVIISVSLLLFTVLCYRNLKRCHWWRFAYRLPKSFSEGEADWWSFNSRKQNMAYKSCTHILTVILWEAFIHQKQTQVCLPGKFVILGMILKIAFRWPEGPQETACLILCELAHNKNTDYMFLCPNSHVLNVGWKRGRRGRQKQQQIGRKQQLDGRRGESQCRTGWGAQPGTLNLKTVTRPEDPQLCCITALSHKEKEMLCPFIKQQDMWHPFWDISSRYLGNVLRNKKQKPPCLYHPNRKGNYNKV